jgi:uncharacterized protein
MRQTRALIALMLATCAGVAGLAVRLVPAPSAVVNPIAIREPVPPARQATVTPLAQPIPRVNAFTPQDFPALAALPPLTMGQMTPVPGLLSQSPLLSSHLSEAGQLEQSIKPSPAVPAPAPTFALPAGQRPMVAIVIDDMGPNAGETRRALASLPPAVTFAFLPYAPDVRAQVAHARSGGHEVIVHIPMQPLDSAQNPGSHALLAGLSSGEIRRRLLWNLSQFDGFTGINNHMGSRFTADAQGMDVVMQDLAQRGIFFLDSRTIGHTAARATARRYGVPLLERDVFLDDVNSTESITRQLHQTLVVARRQGKAIAIGHPRPLTRAALEAWLPTAETQGFRLVSLSQILHHTRQQAAR